MRPLEDYACGIGFTHFRGLIKHERIRVYKIWISRFKERPWQVSGFQGWEGSVGMDFLEMTRCYGTCVSRGFRLHSRVLEGCLHIVLVWSFFAFACDEGFSSRVYHRILELFRTWSLGIFTWLWMIIAFRRFKLEKLRALRARFSNFCRIWVNFLIFWVFLIYLLDLLIKPQFYT